jgi:FkbM family methyltransferase
VIRALLERMLSRIVVRRRLPPSMGGGELLASAGAGGLKFLLKRSDKLDPALLAMAARTVVAGSVVWDVGANVGLFSVAAGGLAGNSGKVFAFEADLDVARLLQATARLRGNRELASICVVPLAVSRGDGILAFEIAARARASNALTGYGRSQMGGVSEVRWVPAMSLDQIREHLPAPTVLKIDVEGAELAVLEGGRRILAEDRPLLLCEVCPANAEAVARLLEAAGYRILDGGLADGGLRPADAGFAPWDTVGVPQEHAMLKDEVQVT